MEELFSGPFTTSSAMAPKFVDLLNISTSPNIVSCSIVVSFVRLLFVRSFVVKCFGDAKMSKMQILMVAVNFVQKSPKLELSSRSLSRSKFCCSERSWHKRDVLLGAQEMSCVDHRRCPAWNTGDVLLRKSSQLENHYQKHLKHSW